MVPCGCILSKFYIKPQPVRISNVAGCGCILSKFYIKPQPAVANVAAANGCILSKFYIKPQLVRNYYGYSQVVSYRNSTSNHNLRKMRRLSASLYLIEILHQTTTLQLYHPELRSCILSKFYIKPQPSAKVRESLKGCILSKFYIKPQHFDFEKSINYVVSYRNSTSNHNPR